MAIITVQTLFFVSVAYRQQQHYNHPTPVRQMIARSTIISKDYEEVNSWSEGVKSPHSCTGDSVYYNHQQRLRGGEFMV